MEIISETMKKQLSSQVSEVLSKYNPADLGYIIESIETDINTTTFEIELAYFKEKKPTDPHKKSKDEATNITLIHYHVNNNTPSGRKIRDAFEKEFPNEPMFISTVESGANRNTHYDLKLQFENDLKTVEFKGSQYYKPIDSSKNPWVNGVQFYNGSGKNFSIAQKYARKFYDLMMDIIIEHLQIKSPKPSFEDWSIDAFAQGKLKTPFVRELKEKGQIEQYLFNLRKEFNNNFTATDMDLIILKKEVQTIADSALNCKDYWLQIHGDINDPELFHVKWSAKILMPQIQKISQVISKEDCCNINFNIICVDGSKFSTILRWGSRQCIKNLRLDIK